METAKHISDLFGQYGKSGWVCKILTSTQIMSGFTGSAGKFSLYVEIKEGWLLFVVSDFLDVTGTKISFEDIYRLLLQLNGEFMESNLHWMRKGKSSLSAMLSMMSKSPWPSSTPPLIFSPITRMICTPVYVSAFLDRKARRPYDRTRPHRR